MTYHKDDFVFHNEFGRGQVISVEDGEAVHIHFFSSDIKRMDPNTSLMEVISQAENELLEKAEQNNFMQTFSSPEPDNEHKHGDHLGIFFEDITDFFKDYLKKAIETSGDVFCWADTKSPPFPIPSDEPQLSMRIWPAYQRYGVAMICRQDLVAKNQHLDSVFPRISEGTQYTFILDKVHRWANRSEAQLTGYIWEEREVTFFDTLYSKYRCFYAAGQTYEVILSGLAFVCKIIEQPEQMDITNPELVAVYKNMGVLTIKDEKTYINTKNSAAFIPTAEQYDRDEYYFRAPVKSISEESIFGSVIYKIRATVARTYDAHTDIDLDIFVHPRVLKDGKVPKVGDDIEGTLWLQGYVWCLNDHRNAAKKFKEAVLKR